MEDVSIRCKLSCTSPVCPSRLFRRDSPFPAMLLNLAALLVPTPIYDPVLDVLDAELVDQMIRKTPCER